MKSVVDYDKVIQELKGKKISKPQVGTLSGHAAGEPFDKYVCEIVKKQRKGNTFR